MRAFYLTIHNLGFGPEQDDKPKIEWVKQHFHTLGHLVQDALHTVRPVQEETIGNSVT